MQSQTIKKDYSIQMSKASIASLPFGVFAVVEFILFSLVWGFERIKSASDMLLPWYFFPIFVVGIVLHELIHGLSWMLAARLTFKQMKFGFQLKTLTPYAHCTVPIPKSAYVFGTFMPALILGFFPFLLSLINGNGWIFLFSVLFTFAAVGDFLIVYMIRNVSWTALVEDHPQNAGCFVYEAVLETEKK
jgi:hypothetical protein